jgi:hypothetical protein
MTFCVARICGDSSTPVLLRLAVQSVAPGLVGCRCAKVDRRARGFPERVVVFRTLGNRFLVVIERSRDVERGVGAISLRKMIFGGLRSGSTRKTKNHYCGAYAQTHLFSRRLSVPAGFTPTNPE